MSKQTELAQLGDAVTVNSSNIGIGTSSPSSKLHVNGIAKFDNYIHFGGTISTPSTAAAIYRPADNQLAFSTANNERMRIDASGNLLVGKTSAAYNTDGFEARPNGETYVSRTGTPMAINRNSSDGVLLNFYKDGSGVGSIGAKDGDLVIGTGDTGFRFVDGSNAIIPQNISSNSGRDNAIDLGTSGSRFDDIYATNGTIQTSDRNEKQDIEELTEAEQRVAVAAKGLLRKFRWKSAVAKKGDNARTHFGIIAQDLQAAFAAEGLDAGDYAMFISTTWWETQTEVPAVEADEENGIEAADAYTRTDTYDTAEEAPEGATQKTRLGVRYSELLAFIIGAL